MNIHQLLSVSQGSPQTQSLGAFSQQDAKANGLFHQTLLQASGAQRLSAPAQGGAAVSHMPQLQAQLNELSYLLSEAPANNLENLSEVLQTLGLDVSDHDLSKLLAQLQQPSSDVSLGALGLDTGEASTPLDEIAGRLALIASFTESNSEAQLESSITPDALETIAEQLNINQTEAAQLASALNALVSQLQSASPHSNESAQLINVRSPVAELQSALKPQADTFFSQMNTGSAAQQITPHTAAPQISSEALMAALLTADGASKASPSSEHSLTGVSLNTGSSPLATSQSTQGFSPTVTPTATTLATPLTSPAWPQQLSQQLVQISQRGGEQHVQMQLNPAELGPLSISLKFGDQGAQAHFLSAHAQVRQVLEQAIPQLREALAEQGISLGETSVGEQRDPNDQAFAQSSGKRGATGGSDNGEIGSDDAPIQNAGSSSLTLDGRVDLYA